MKQLFAIVGAKHRGQEEFLASLPANEPLTLVREADNKYDRNAIQVWARGRHIGFVPKTQNAALAAFIDRNGKDLVVVMRGGVVGDEQVTHKAIEAKLHRGNNVYPLAEVGE